jgi:DNA-binding GntR family transcriptional regulator
MDPNDNRLEAMVIEPPKSVSDQVYDHLKMQIIYGEIAPGERLAQEKVANQLATSRMPVREAFRRLEHDGLIQRLPQGGVRVSPITVESVRQVYGVRGALESYAVELACGGISGDAIDRLNYIKHQADLLLTQENTDPRNDLKKFFDLNTAFHDTIYEATGNPYLIKMIMHLRNLVLRMRALGLRKRSTWIQVWSEHGRLMDSLKNGDKDAACHCMMLHIANAASYVVTVVLKEKTEYGAA